MASVVSARTKLPLIAGLAWGLRKSSYVNEHGRSG
jgi:hypothetical protein